MRDEDEDRLIVELSATDQPRRRPDRVWARASPSAPPHLGKHWDTRDREINRYLPAKENWLYIRSIGLLLITNGL